MSGHGTTGTRLVVCPKKDITHHGRAWEETPKGSLAADGSRKKDQCCLDFGFTDFTGID
jgi:hypothetical protein